MKVFSSTQLFCCHDPMKFHGSLVFSSQYSDRGKKSQLHKISATIIINQILQGLWEARLMVSTLDKYGLSCLVWTAGLGHCVAFLTRHFYSYSAFLGGEYTFSRFPDLTYKFQLTSPLACGSSCFFQLLFQSTCFFFCQQGNKSFDITEIVPQLGFADVFFLAGETRAQKNWLACSRRLPSPLTKSCSA